MVATAKQLCGARTRAGTPCQRWPRPNGRCKLHGGASTGPRTPDGKERSIVALISGYYAWRERKRVDSANTSPKAPVQA
jgi:hypothetical protein